MFSRFTTTKKPPLTREEQLKAQRNLASIKSRTEEETQKDRDKKYGKIPGRFFKTVGDCVGEGCGLLQYGKDEYLKPHLDKLGPYGDAVWDRIDDDTAECMKYTGKTYVACVERVKETAQNAAEVAQDTARNMAVRTQEAMIRTLPNDVQSKIHTTRRDSDARQQHNKSQEELDKQFPEFQLFVITTGGRTYTLLVHGYDSIRNIRTLLEDKEVKNFNSFLFNGNTYNVNENLLTKLSNLKINSDNQTITIMSGGMKKTKKRRKSTTTKRRKMVRRRKGTKRRV
jgi:hypothetical protein